MIETLHIQRSEFEPQTLHFSTFKTCEQNSLEIKLQTGGKNPCGLQHTLDLADPYMAGDLMLFQTYRKDKSIIFSYSHLALSQRLAHQFWNWNRNTASVKIPPVLTTTFNVKKRKKKYYMVHVLIQRNLKPTSIKKNYF